MIDHFITQNPTSSTASLFRAPKIEHVRPKVSIGDNGSRYLNFTGTASFIGSRLGVHGSDSQSEFDFSTLQIDMIISRVKDSSIDKNFGNISDEVSFFTKRALMYLNSRNIIHHNVYAMDDGGISIEVNHSDGYYYDFSFYNEGYGSIIKHKEGDIPKAWEHSHNLVYSYITSNL